MYVCLCKAVTNQQVKDAVDQGQSYGEMRRSLGLATDCGCCGRAAKQLIREHVSTLPACEFANVG
ncbi:MULTISPECIES: (2Fe-2S)-binding protein [unclassified Oceanobacter]|jgi:bacterioferritin-associated ferredoxin|uniref:(2Fe-2S)-binding protein n=1 Tax=unclassified Oceanobacter TaxID=2620260 RepID=UPI0026E39A57|nr:MULTISPECIES: (2Fe-2S)-binding protein [unclassified Oceanobacter]MDO6682181.1 (2Fe-2S)-binding protein [Oceanobacter sp. 5_MG-2023]MDP2504914.1 (2Fe-2S)-binding protein [Oceanobacter sp. 3_MG-2023]MDP2546358.1 (2Fe-2S)-binding protein [Oceanobacter sp. 4_MG-2023]MDP2610555.1 (2Fe-2S)-binding protein [Oceanobacter sp. 1_MG-2023]MDP2613836.1 (2Fe-2S)-binding protein [Oceanobacter sp. 2_MG-2023]